MRYAGFEHRLLVLFAVEPANGLSASSSSSSTSSAPPSAAATPGASTSTSGGGAAAAAAAPKPAAKTFFRPYSTSPPAARPTATTTPAVVAAGHALSLGHPAYRPLTATTATTAAAAAAPPAAGLLPQFGYAQPPPHVLSGYNPFLPFSNAGAFSVGSTGALGPPAAANAGQHPHLQAALAAGQSTAGRPPPPGAAGFTATVTAASAKAPTPSWSRYAQKKPD